MLLYNTHQNVIDQTSIRYELHLSRLSDAYIIGPANGLLLIDVKPFFARNRYYNNKQAIVIALAVR